MTGSVAMRGCIQYFKVPVHEKSEAQVRRNIEYGRAGGESLLLDAFLPAGPGPFPVAILVHGGGWVAGDRRGSMEPLIDPLQAAGFACLSITYRMAKQIATFGAAVEDVEQAASYAQAHAAELRLDPRKFALIGESAGAQLAAMAALGSNAAMVKAVVGLCIPADLEDLVRGSAYIPEPFRQGLMLARLRKLSPIHNLRAGMPPFLLIHGTADRLTPFEQSRKLCRAIRRAGGACDLVAVNGGTHGLGRWESAGLATYKRLLVDWLAKRAG
jgi:acetyl esterase